MHATALRPRLFDADAIVIGSGAGGSTFAYAYARAGRSVLVLERGRFGQAGPDPHDERATLIDKRPYCDRPVEVNGTLKRLYVGGIPGGGTALYGAALLRPSRDDFHPGRHYGRRLPHHLWDWPLAYDDLEPHYDEAEQLYRVAGCVSDDFGPLQKPRSYPGQPLPLRPINERLVATSRAGGLHPFRLPLAIDATLCLRCASCAGFVCPTGARRSSAHLLERAAAEGLPLRVLTGVEVEELLRDGAGSVDGVRVRQRDTGDELVFRARHYVLAAGAIGSPLLLQRSGLGGPHVGRHYMTHLSPIVAGLFPGRTEAELAFVKQIGFADFYFGTKDFAHKLGLVQSLPVPGPLLTAKTTPKFFPKRLTQLLRQHMLPLAGIVEDLPDPDNRVTWGPHGQPRLTHSFSPYDRERGRKLSKQMARILRRAGAKVCVTKRFPSDEHMAHQCGTLRFGRDSRHAALGPDCRLFGHDNLFAVDGSFFPTSLGVGPALTIMANALRVGELAAREV